MKIPMPKPAHPFTLLLLVALLTAISLPAFSQETGIFTDQRDDQEYRWVNIEDQTWMAQNLNYTTSNSWCYENSLQNCEKYGRLYSWESALKVCPDNWHLPGEEEWVILERALGMSEEEVKIMLHRGEGTGTKLKNENAWEVKDGQNHGYNTTGFNAIPGGFHYTYQDRFAEKGIRASWWSSTPEGPYAMRRALFLHKTGIDRDPATRTLGFSVRCLQDD